MFGMAIRAAAAVIGVGLSACATPEQEAPEQALSCYNLPSPTVSREHVMARAKGGIAWREAAEAEAIERGQSFVPAERISMVGPNFPANALACGYEGDCAIAFDVGPDGNTTNIEPACTLEMFEGQAKRAIARFEFSPLMIDGEPQLSPDHATALKFEMAQ